MNSLFVGPYRQSDMNGLHSQALLNYLYRNVPKVGQLIARNIFISPNNIMTNADQPYIKQTETFIGNIDTLIQHTPLDSIYLSQHISNNVCIPIMDNRIPQDDHIYRLSMCSKVLVDNYTNYKFLANLINNVHMVTYDPIFSIDGLPSINLGIYRDTNKMYFIGDYAGNRDLIKDLIMCFTVFSLKNDNLSLVIFLTNAIQKDIQELQNLIQKIYKDLEVTNVFSKVVCTGIGSTIQSLIACHMSGDIYLNINDNPRNGLNSLYAQKFNHEILDLAEVGTHRIIARNGVISKNNTYDTPTQSGIIDAMDRLLLRNNNKTTDLIDKKELCEILWQQ